MKKLIAVVIAVVVLAGACASSDGTHDRFVSDLGAASVSNGDAVGTSTTNLMRESLDIGGHGYLHVGMSDSRMVEIAEAICDVARTASTGDQFISALNIARGDNYTAVEMGALAGSLGGAFCLITLEALGFG